jgi:hypothetical protein
MLLRGFTTPGSSKQVRVFDKKTGKRFSSGIDAVAAEFGYYDIGPTTLDGLMTRVDGDCSRVINLIRKNRSLGSVNSADRGILALFSVLQMLRTRGFQEGYSHLGNLLIETVKERGLKPPEGWEEELLDEKQQRADYLRVIPEFAKGFLPHLLNKDLLLLKTSVDTPFCVSDNPLTLTNTINDGDGLRGTVGLAVPGIEIYLPITTELTLGYFCPTIGISFEQDKHRLSRVGGLINEDGFYYLQSRNLGKAMLLKPEQVRFQNSLQIRNAERFVVSSRDDFEDVADMIGQYPAMRIGPRMSVAR